MDLFLILNGINLNFSLDETIEIFVKIATNEIMIDELSKWLSGIVLT